MQRCIQLAKLGAGTVAPNPLVGAVLVHNGKIIGEGFHQEFGKAHAEVNCLLSVATEDVDLIPLSALYVSLEPCAHYGKTPPCVNLIIEKGIRTVVIGCTDSYKEVDGKGIQILQNAGVEVITGILDEECRELNKRFFCFHEKKRPYIILKWAQTANGFIAANHNDRLMISNEHSNKLVHKWRSEEAAILVGTNTAIKDNPLLNNRYWLGGSPIKMVIDLQLKLPLNLRMFNEGKKVIVFNVLQERVIGNRMLVKLIPERSIVHQITEIAYQLGLQSLFIEGGAATLNYFIEENLWDEARIIINTKQFLQEGLRAPVLQGYLFLEMNMLDDMIQYYCKRND